MRAQWFIACSLLLPLAASAKDKVKEKLPLAAGADLVVAIDTAQAATCKDWPCTLDLRLTDGKPPTWQVDGADKVLHAWEGEGKDGVFVRFVVGADGAWTAWWKAAEDKKKKGDDDEDAEATDGDAKDEGAKDEGAQDGDAKDGDAKDGDAKDDDAKKGAGKKGDDEEPEDDSWKDKPVLTRAELVDKMFEKARGGEKTVQVGSGAASAGESGLTLTLPAGWLPAGDFEVGVNGYWGATVQGVVIGSGGKTGVVALTR